MEDLKEVLIIAQKNQEVLNKDIALCNNLERRLRGILRLCTPDEEYSAFVATAVLCDMDYRDLKNILLTAGRWSDELRELEAVAMPCVYSTTR